MESTNRQRTSAIHGAIVTDATVTLAIYLPDCYAFTAKRPN